MPPATVPKTKTSAGLETVDQTVARAQQMLSPNTGLATSTTPSRLKINVPPVIPASTLSSDATISDAFARRGELEQQSMATGQLSTDYQNLFGRINNLQATPLSNPDQFINRLLLNRPTETQQALDTQRGTQAETIRGFAGELQQAGTQAREQLGVAGLQEGLAGTRNRIAERIVKLRETLRDFETNAERRGVAREFVESEKAKVQADAAAELADLAIIEQAQLGNLNEARAEVDTILAEKRQAFEFENAAIEAEIARLEQIDTREADIRKEQLQIALTERNRNIETALANEKEQRGYLVDAAANGADQGTLDAIRRASSPAQAALLAGPWIGRLDRQMQQAQIANIYDQINARAVAAREAVLTATTEQEKVQQQKVADAEQALEISTLANQLAEAAGLSSAIGFGFKKSVIGSIPFVSGEAIAGTDRADFEAQATRLGNLLTLDNLKLMSGVLTDRDIQLLATAGSNLLNFNMSEEQYKKEIERVVSTMNRTIQNNGVTPEQAVFYGLLEPQDIQTLDAVWDNL